MNVENTYSYWLYNYRDAIAKGLLIDHCRFRGFGSREGMLNTLAGEDIWMGVATSIPIPASIGVQCSVVSTSANDTFINGSGIRSLDIHYLDADGNIQEEVINMNGLTPINTVATNIRFIQDIHAKTVGSGGVSAGIITIYLVENSTIVYQQIGINTNRSLSSMRMVPLGKNFYLTKFSGSAVDGSAFDGKSIKITLRATAHSGELYPGVFLFQQVYYMQNSNFCHIFDPVLKFPPLTIIKCTAWAIISGANINASWEGWYEKIA